MNLIEKELKELGFKVAKVKLSPYSACVYFKRINNQVPFLDCDIVYCDGEFEICNSVGDSIDVFPNSLSDIKTLIRILSNGNDTR